MFQVIQRGTSMDKGLYQFNALLFVSWISRAIDWGWHNWVRDKAPVSRLKLFIFHQDLNPHLDVIFRPGHGILFWYLNSHFTGTKVRHPHHDNIKWVGWGQWILVLYYLSRTIHYTHLIQSLLWLSQKIWHLSGQEEEKSQGSNERTMSFFFFNFSSKKN